MTRNPQRAPYPAAWEVDGALTAEDLNTVRYADAFSGADMAVQTQNAIDDLPTDGGKVIIPGFSGNISNQIRLRDLLLLQGSQIQATRLRAGNSFSPSSLVRWAPSSNGFFSGLRDLQLRGDSQNARGLEIINNGGTPNDSHISDVYVNAFNNEGMYFDDMWGYRIQNCLVESCGSNLTGTGTGNGAVYFKGDQSYISNFFVSGNNATYGVELDAAEEFLFSNLHVKTNDKHGAQIRSNRNKFCGIQVVDNGQASSGTYNGFRIGANGKWNAILGGHFNGANQTRVGLQLLGDRNYATGLTFENHTFVDIRFDGNYNVVYTSTEGLTIDDNGEGNVLNGRVLSPETLSLGGTDGTVSPTLLPVGVIPFNIDAGGSATELEGIAGSVRRDGQTIRVIHTGGENVTLVNNDTAETGTLINKSGGNITLGTNGDMAEYTWSTQASKWIGGEVATQ